MPARKGVSEDVPFFQSGRILAVPCSPKPGTAPIGRKDGGRFPTIWLFSKCGHGADTGEGQKSQSAGNPDKYWLPPRDSNPDMLIQSQLSYH